MGRTITINPVTRIEGHAKVTIELGDDGKVSAALLHVLEFRGFERFVQGMHIEKMPTVTSRICGTCPHAHHLAASKAVDAVFGVEIPRAARLLRELLNAGSIIHSHAIHFFALAGPDLFIGVDAAAEKRNLVALLSAAPELGKKALRLRSIGQRISEEVGGRGTHPVTCVAGGMASGITSDTRKMLLGLAEEAVTLTQDVLAAGKDALTKNDVLLRSFEQKVHDLATTKDGALEFYDGPLRLKSPDGKTERELKAENYRDVMVEEALPHSYAKQVLLRANGSNLLPYRVGPLARLNCIDSIGTLLAAAEFRSLPRALGHALPLHCRATSRTFDRDLESGRARGRDPQGRRNPFERVAHGHQGRSQESHRARRGPSRSAHSRLRGRCRCQRHGGQSIGGHAA
ncbi:MAG: Ni/Fe hydrogenase subunit alpha [Polyangiaceae bacterium]